MLLQDLLFGERFHAGKFSSAQKFERSAAAGRDVRNFAGNAGLVDGGHGIAAAYDGGGAGHSGCGDSFSNLQGALAKAGISKTPIGPFQTMVFALEISGGEQRDGLRADVEAHLIVRSGGYVDSGGRGVGFELGRDDVVNRKKKLEIFGACVVEDFSCQVQLFVFHQGFADGLALSLQKGVRHSSTDEHGVGDFHQVLDHFDLVADFCAAEYSHERPRGISDGFAQVGQLLFHEQAGCGLLDEMGDAHNGGVARSAEPKASQTKRPSQRAASCFENASSFFSSSAWKRTFSSSNTSPSFNALLASSIGTDTLVRKRDGLAQEFFEFFRGGL